MKNAIPVKFILSLAVLAGVLIGNRSLQNAGAQTQAAPPANSNLVSTSPHNTPAASALPPDIAPDSPLAQIVRLVQAGLEQSVILTYINDSTNLFNLDADKIIYLNDLGVPTEIINAMMQHDQQLEQTGVTPATQSTQAVATTETQAQPSEVTVNYFYDTLAPYGTWLNVAGYGWCWRPTVVIYQTGWQPYCNNGHWVYTDYGWYWLSGYSWGWATFHYGRWFRIPRYGWCWWPDTTWAPSWVCWRYNKDYCGWAPLPPHAVYRPGIGLVYHGHAVGAGFHLGLNVSAFTFVPTRDFHNRQPWRHRLAEKEAAHIYDHTTFIHKMEFNRHNQTVLNPGIPPHDITAVTKQPIRPIAIHYERGKIMQDRRHEKFEQGGRALVITRPHFVGSPVLSPRHGAVPTTGHQQKEFHPPVRRNEPRVSPRPATPEPNNAHRPEANPNMRKNFNRGMRRVPQAAPAYPSQQNRQNESPRTFHRNGSSVFQHTWNSRQNNYQRPTANRNPTFTTPPPPEHKTIIGAPSESNSPHPTQNQAPNCYYNHDRRFLSPRARGFETPAPDNVFRGTPQGGNPVNERHFSAPPANHYSPPAGQRQSQYHYNAPRNEFRNHAEHFNHSAPRQQAVRPHTTYYHQPSPPRPAARQPQNQQGEQKGR